MQYANTYLVAILASSVQLVVFAHLSSKLMDVRCRRRELLGTITQGWNKALKRRIFHTAIYSAGLFVASGALTVSAWTASLLGLTSAVRGAFAGLGFTFCGVCTFCCFRRGRNTKMAWRNDYCRSILLLVVINVLIFRRIIGFAVWDFKQAVLFLLLDGPWFLGVG